MVHELWTPKILLVHLLVRRSEIRLIRSSSMSEFGEKSSTLEIGGIASASKVEGTGETLELDKDRLKKDGDSLLEMFESWNGGYALDTKTITKEVMCGITVSIAQVPEAVSFSFVAGVDPVVGLTAAWIIGVVTATAGGRPAMISGATGAIAAVIGDLVGKHGVEYLFFAVIVMGSIQVPP